MISKIEKRMLSFALAGLMVLSPVSETLNVQAAEDVKKIQVESGQESDVQTNEKQEVSESAIVEKAEQEEDVKLETLPVEAEESVVEAEESVANTEETAMGTAVPVVEKEQLLSQQTDLSYSVLDETAKTCEITRYTGTSVEVTVPAEIDGYKVVSIGEFAYEHTNAVTVYISEGIENIGRSAFGFSKIETINIPSSVKVIEDEVFQSCSSLKNINVAEKNTEFVNVNGVLFTKDMTRLIRGSVNLDGTYVVSDSVITIDNSALYNCYKVDSFTIMDNVKSLGRDALPSRCFVNTDGQTEAYKYCERNDCIIHLVERSAGEYNYQILDINKKECALSGYMGTDIKFIVPQKIAGYTVTGIGTEAFLENKQLTDVVLHEGITTIGDSAFKGCTGLTEIIIPDSVTTIGQEVFRYCENITKVSLGANLKKFNTDIFDSCISIEQYLVSTQNLSYSSDNGILMDKNKTAVILYPPAKKDAVVTLPRSVTSIEHRAFMDCRNITKISIPESVKNLGSAAFLNCSNLTELIIPEGIITIPYQLCQGCSSLIELTIPSSVTTINSWAFYLCDSLKNVLIPENVSSIGEKAFSNCTGLEKINVAEANKSYSSLDGMLFDKEQTMLIQCGGGKKGECVIPEGVTSLSYYAFNECNLLTSLSIPSGLSYMSTSVYGSAMLNTIIVSPDNPNYSSKDGNLYNKDFTRLIKIPCNKTGDYIMPESVNSLDVESAFMNCSKLKNITLSSALTNVSGREFKTCKGLEGIHVSEGNTAYSSKNGVLYNKDMSSLVRYPLAGAKDYTVPDSVTKIEYVALYGCRLNSVILPSNLESVERMAFVGNDFKKVIIPASVTKIEPYAFGYAEPEQYAPEKIEGFTICGKPDTAAEIYAKENGFIFEEVKPEPPKFELQGSSMVLGNNLNFESYIPTDQLNGRTDVYAKVTKTYADGRPDVTQKVPYKDWKDGEKPGLKYVEFIGVSAKEMMDTVTIQVFDNDDHALSKASVDSIHDYALRMLQDETSSDALKTLLVDMLNYGAACQIYFNYAPANLANRDIDAYQSYATKEIVCTNSRENDEFYAGTSLITKSNIKMVMYFKNLKSDMKAVVTFKNHRGKDLSFTVEGKDFELYHGLYGVIIDKLAVADVSQPVKCEIYDKDGKLVTSAVDSMESYVARMGKDESVFNSIMKFGTSSHAFFHSK